MASNALREPHDVNTERELLQSCFQTQKNKLGTEEVIKYVIGSAENHYFAHPHHEKIYMGIVEAVRDMGVGNVSWSDVRDYIHEESSARKTLRDIASSGAEAQVNEKRLDKLLKRLQEYAKARAMNELVESAKKKMLSGQGNSAYDMLVSGLYDIGREDNMRGGQFVESYADDILTEIDERRNNNGVVGLRTGLNPLDYGFMGLQKKQFILVGARPGNYKSASLGQACMHIAEQGYRALLATPEMATEQYVMRVACGAAGISYDDYNAGNYDEKGAQRLKDVVNQIRQRNIVVNESGYQNTDDIRADLIRFQPDVLFVDYLQLVEPSKPTGNEYRDVSKVANELNMLKKDFNIPVVAAVQLSRAVEQRDNKRPIPSDLRSSGQIEQAADGIYFLYYAKSYAEQDEVGGYWIGDEQIDPYKLEWVCGKNRHGKPQDFDTWIGENDMVIRNER